MGKLRNEQSGFSTVEAILILVILCILGFTGWYVWQAKNNSDKNLNSNNSTTPIYKKSVAKQNTAAQLPDGWTWYEGDGFKFGYPTVYKQFSAGSMTYAASGTQVLLTSGSPATAPFPGLSTSGTFVLSKLEADNTPLVSRKYGPTVKLENGKWIVIQDNSSDPKKYKVGNTYTEVTTTKKSGMTVYTFRSGDEGGVVYTLAFTAKGHLYTLQLPEFDTGTYASSKTTNDQKPYDQLSNQLAEHVVVQ